MWISFHVHVHRVYNTCIMHVNYVVVPMLQCYSLAIIYSSVALIDFA